MTITTIEPNELLKRHKAGEKVELIDVRTPVEYREVHVEFAKNYPLDRLDPSSIVKARTSTDAPLYVICKAGGRGQTACEKFIAAGFENVVNVEGGTSACEKSGLPVVRGKKAMSLERQVRIAAGALVFSGVLLGTWVSGWFYILSGFVGGGLMFAGITDTCMMGMLIAKMPWNQCKV